MKGAVAEQNYWPGYLDALINVMLNLLFLVAVFAIGLLLLNVQTMSQQRQLTDLGAQQGELGAQQGERGAQQGELGAQTREILNEMGLGEAQKGSLLARLERLNVAEMVERRRRLGLLSEEVAAQESLMARIKLPEPAPPPVPAVTAAAVPAPAPAAPDKADAAEAAVKAQKKRLEEKALQLAEAEQRLKALAEQLAQGQRQLAALQASRAQPVADQIVDFRVAGRSTALASAQTAAALRQVLGAAPQAVWEFAADEFEWPRGKSLPLGYAVADKAAGWKLVVFTEADNPRVMRESFARGNATREWMVRDGHLRGQIQLELKPSVQVPGLDEQSMRQVYMLPRLSGEQVKEKGSKQ
jgi:hypothetical protein